MRRLFRQFSFPGGIPSHVAPETPGSIHEGGELGYSLVHAYGAVFDNPDLLALLRGRRRRGRDGAAGGELALEQVRESRARRRGAAGPAPERLQDRQPDGARADQRGRAALAAGGLRALAALRRGRRSGDRAPGARRHARRASSTRSPRIQQQRASAASSERPRWPMIVLRTPKGWTGPKEVDGLPAEGTFRSHQVPLANLSDEPGAPARARAVAALLPARGAVRRGRRACATELRALRPEGERRMSANPHANGGSLLRDLELPDFRDYAVDVDAARHDVDRGHAGPGRLAARRHAGESIRRQLPRLRPRRDGLEPARRRCSRRPTGPGWPTAATGDDHLSPDGRVMEILSEHLCQGWLEGYLLTGRHGLFNCYEAFIHIVDSMFNQHAKWLKVTRDDPVAQADRVAQLPALLARLAPGPQRLLASGPRLHRPRREQEGGDRARLPAAGRELPAVGRRPLPALAQLRERDRRRQAAVARLPVDGRRADALHPRDRHLGVGVERRTAASPTWCSRAPATSRPSRRSPPPRCCASTCPSCGCGW